MSNTYMSYEEFIAKRRLVRRQRAGPHTPRHPFSTHLLEAGTDIRILQDILGHKSVETTMSYTHVIKDRFAGIRNPLDML